MDCFEGEQQELVVNSEFDREPVELLWNRCDVEKWVGGVGGGGVVII